MEDALKKLEELDMHYELVNHKPVFTIEDMNHLDKEIFKGAEICKNLFLRDQKGKRHFLVILCSEKKADMANIQEQALSTRLSFAGNIHKKISTKDEKKTKERMFFMKK